MVQWLHYTGEFDKFITYEVICCAVQDVLENEEIKLDSVFKFSLIQDLVRVRRFRISSIV